jgi:hypothetical protein
MTTRTWIGGGNNRASNPLDWSPTGAPQPGDSLEAEGQGGALTINVRHNDLAGDEFTALGVSLTANLTHNATMSAFVGFGGSATFNVSGHSTLSFFSTRDPTMVNLSQNSTLTVEGVDRTTATINMSGRDTANLGLNVVDNVGGYIVNLSHRAEWTGTLKFSTTGASLAASVTVNGGANTFFNNDGNSAVVQATINADVVGNGSIDVDSVMIGSGSYTGKLEFMQSVGRHQTVTDNGVVQIDQPREFAASITLATTPAGNSPAQIDLEGLANADSYTFTNDMLRLFSGNKVIDKLRLTDQTQYGFAVQKTASSVNIVGIDPTHPATGTLLPIHS